MTTAQPAMNLLELRGVTVSFDGFLALNDLNLQLAPGELRAVIGPNGAGKTTFLDVITGKVRPTKGDVLFRGASLVGQSEHRISRLGIGRKFQTPRVYQNLTPRRNLEARSSGLRSPCSWPRIPNCCWWMNRWQVSPTRKQLVRGSCCANWPAITRCW